jgi:addiction module HigA family antidote
MSKAVEYLFAFAVADQARALGLSRYQLSQIIAEKRPVTTKTAKRLESVIGSTAQSWTNMQTAHDQWRCR